MWHSWNKFLLDMVYHTYMFLSILFRFLYLYQFFCLKVRINRGQETENYLLSVCSPAGHSGRAGLQAKAQSFMLVCPVSGWDLNTWVILCYFVHTIIRELDGKCLFLLIFIPGFLEWFSNVSSCEEFALFLRCPEESPWKPFDLGFCSVVSFFGY